MTGSRSLPLLRLFGIRVGVNYSWFLVLFGGVMKMSRDTDSPGAEFRVAVAGPLVTLLLMALSALAAVLLAGADSFWDAARLSATADATPAEVVISLLVSMNL